MSGYLEVKYPLKSNLGLYPFKSWKRQWCILRPSPTFTGGMIAVYCSEAGASAGTVELPLGCVVRRAKSRTRPHAFAVFAADEPRKPRVLLAGNTHYDAQNWMEKIKALINGSELIGTNPLLKDSYSVTVSATELSRKCGLNGADSTVSFTSNGVSVSRSQKLGVFVEWKHIKDVMFCSDPDRNRTCVLTVDSGFRNGGGELRFSSPLASELVTALKEALAGVRGSKKLSKSEGDLRTCSDTEMGEVRRSSWYRGPSEMSLDDLDLVMSKECKSIPVGQLLRCSAAGHLAPLSPAQTPVSVQVTATRPVASFDDSMSDRRSLLSVASGIYEEIPDLPVTDTTDTQYCKMSRDVPDGVLKLREVEARILAEEPTYESVSECAFATAPRARRRAPPLPPPRPPRLRPGVGEAGSVWRAQSCGAGVTRHCSLGALPLAAPASAPAHAPAHAHAHAHAPAHAHAHAHPHAPADAEHKTKTLPRWDRSRQAFSAFRKRLKSDSRTISPKSETSKEKDVETKKKKFDFTPSRDIFKSFKVSRKMKNLKITNGNLGKGETKSCECLDHTEHVTSNRCSKSVECLEGNDEFTDDFEADLSIEFNDDDVAALSLPQEIVDLILSGHDRLNKIRLKDEENEYMPMSPIVPPPVLEHHYIVMSPRTNIA